MGYGPIIVLLASLVTVGGQESTESDLKNQLDILSQEMADLKTDLENERTKFQNLLGGLTRQVMMQQFSMEESMRSGGDSGIKQARHQAEIGTRSYISSTHTNSRAVNAIHDHSDNKMIVGMGEIVAVLNGVEFRTRHNDYPLHQPHDSDTGYLETTGVEFPPVPPTVLPNMTISEQVAEMTKWFKAWKEQNTTERDYRPYFKPLMCYMEGYWTQTGEDIDEPFHSTRHRLDASTWWDLMEKVSFIANSGSKSRPENYAFLPTKIMNLINNDTDPVWAQWNYRILCAPVKDIPTRFLRPIDDLSSRITKVQSLEEYAMSRKARFFPNDNFNAKSCTWCYIDSLMGQIPGLDNYAGDLTDDAFGNIALNAGGPNRGDRLNTAYYHRYFDGNRRDASGTNIRLRGFSDRQLYMAQNSQPKIPAMKLTDCESRSSCTDYVQRWSYAIPLEVIYLTPLNNWNPYNIRLPASADETRFEKVATRGRNGRFTKARAFDGNCNERWYHTPEELFTGSEVEVDPADSSQGVVGVLDSEGEVRRVVASGIRIMLPNIPGVGILRQRYPISPIYNDGSTIYKELQVLKDLVLRKRKFKRMFYKKTTLEAT